MILQGGESEKCASIPCFYLGCVFFQGVESEKCASFSRSMEAGKPVYTKASSTLADGKTNGKSDGALCYSLGGGG